MNYKKQQNLQNLPVKHVESIGAVIINPKGKVLIMFQKQNRYWELPKGKVESGEEEITTLKREILEETGIKDLEIIKNFKNNFRYQFTLHGNFIKKNNIYYLAKVKDSKIELSEEHLYYKWVSLNEVNKLFKHKNQKQLINKVKEFIKEHGL